MTCPLCGYLRESERNRRQKLEYLVNTFVVTAVAGIVLVRLILSDDVTIGMTKEDCTTASVLAESTRTAVSRIESNRELASAELLETSEVWSQLASRYTPGKYSWSTSGLEHNWLERLSQSTKNLATGSTVNTEGQADAKRYVIDLTRLIPRYCSV